MQPVKKAVLFIAFLTCLTGCSGLSKLDFWTLYDRAGWQLPEQVIESLNINLGDHVVDIGAGGGYFTFLLAEAVGPTGRVYAVDVDMDITEELEYLVSENGAFNVEVILAEWKTPFCRTAPSISSFSAIPTTILYPAGWIISPT